jgi:hypothetical protein
MSAPSLLFSRLLSHLPLSLFLFTLRRRASEKTAGAGLSSAATPASLSSLRERGSLAEKMLWAEEGAREMLAALAALTLGAAEPADR